MMKYLIKESRLKSVIFKYFDNVFKDSFIQEDNEWYGISTPKYEYLLALKKDDPKTMYYWGDAIGVESGALFGLKWKEMKDYLEDYIKEKFNFKFDRLL